MSVGRSFIKGPRFAFRQTHTLMACEACAWARGAHTCEDRCERCGGTGRIRLGRNIAPCGVCGASGRISEAAAAPRPSDLLASRDGV